MTKNYCLACEDEMRKWKPSNKKCVSMCINKKCTDYGIVYKAIENINNFKMVVEVTKK